MGKIIDFVTKKNIKDDTIKENPKSQSLSRVFCCVDYSTAYNCKSREAYDPICIKCGKCGRKFDKYGILIK